MFKNAKDIKQPRIHVFLYGASGTGKTRQAATFPEPVVISPANENGILTLMGLDVPYVSVKGPEDVDAAISYLEQTQATKGPEALPGSTLVVDSLSHYADLVVESIASMRKGALDQQGWGQVASHFRTLHQRLRNLDMHVVFTSLAETLTNEAGVTIGGRPRLVGSARDLLPSSCDIIAYLEVRDSVTAKTPAYRCYTRPKGGYQARSRFASVPAELTLGLEPGTTLWDQLSPHVAG